MKKIIMIITILIMSLPTILNGKINYEEAINQVNNYKDNLKENELYLKKENLFFGFNNGTLFSSEQFIKSGFVNLSEFNATKDEKGNTYLYDGSNYFTMTEDGENVYEINDSKNKYSQINKTSTSNIRSTHYVNEYVTVEGKGTYTNPWTFLKYKVNVELANATINGKKTYEEYTANNKHQFNVVGDENFSYANSFCDGDKRINTSENNFTIHNIFSDTTCYINYINKVFPYIEETIEYEVELTGNYYLEVYGAQGGNAGGKGGYAKGKVYLEKGDKIYINTGGMNGYNGGGTQLGTGSYSGGGASTIKKGNSYLIIGAGGGATGADGTPGGDGGSGNGTGGISVGSGDGKAGENGGGGSSSPTLEKTCGDGSCLACSTCTYSYTTTCEREVCKSTSCKTCTYNTTCTEQDCSRGYRDENGNWVCYETSYACTKTGSSCSKCGEECTSYGTEDYSCTKKKTAANCNKCGCDKYNLYDCSVAGKPGNGGSNSFGTGVTSITNSSGVWSGNGYAKITYIN